MSKAACGHPASQTTPSAWVATEVVASRFEDDKSHQLPWEVAR
jgi:hypothetical protein